MNTYNVYHQHNTDTVIIGVIEADYYNVSDDNILYFMKRIENPGIYAKNTSESVATYKDWSGVQLVAPKTQPEATLFDEDRA